MNTEAKPPWTLKRKLMIGLLVVAILAVSTAVWIRITYPYGPHPACMKELGWSLIGYASEHDDRLPYGGSSPEASLSLLGRSNLWFLRGKDIPITRAQSAWAKDGKLGPDSCGWHYVEGLRADDGPRIAVAWDKVVGIDHFGQRRRGFAHEVLYLDGSENAFSTKDWPTFAMEQREKLAKLISSRPTNAPPIRWSDEETLGTNWFPVRK